MTSTPIKHTPLTKHSNKAVRNLLLLLFFVNWEKCEQNIEQNRAEKNRITGKKNR